MKILLVDGMGGGVGRSIAEGLLAAKLEADLVAVGTNSLATSNMMKAGISPAATGENAIVYNAANADIIIGPVGIILPNAMFGEISPAMAQAITASAAKKILVPIQNDRLYIAGVESQPLAKSVEAAVRLCAEHAAR